MQGRIVGNSIEVADYNKLLDHWLRCQYGARRKKQMYSGLKHSGTVDVSTDDMAGTYGANVAGGFVTVNCDCVSASRDLLEAVCKRTILDELPSAPHKPVQLY